MILFVESLDYRYPGSSRSVISQLNLECGVGQSLLIVGDNGCGKSTLGKLISGLLQPSSGTVVINEKNVFRLPSRKRVSAAMYVHQENHLQYFKSSLEDEIRWMEKWMSAEADLTQLGAFFVSNDLIRNPHDLSVNEAWRFSLYLSMIAPPTVLFIDEIPAISNRNNRAALSNLMKARHELGLVTVLSYQRILDYPFQAVLAMEEGRLTSV